MRSSITAAAAEAGITGVAGSSDTPSPLSFHQFPDSNLKMPDRSCFPFVPAAAPDRSIVPYVRKIAVNTAYLILPGSMNGTRGIVFHFPHALNIRQAGSIQYRNGHPKVIIGMFT